MARGRIMSIKRNFSYGKKHVRYLLFNPRPKFYYICDSRVSPESETVQGFEAIVQDFLKETPCLKGQKIMLLNGEPALCLGEKTSLTIAQRQFLVGLQKRGLVGNLTIECWVEPRKPLTPYEEIMRKKSGEKSQWKCLLMHHHEKVAL